jgi:anti-anti-sigma factor
MGNSTGQSASGETSKNAVGGHGQVTHAETGGVHVFRYFGKVDYMSAPAIRRYLDGLLEQGTVFGLVFDLTEADGLDSTNLGLLARVNQRASGLGGGKSMIVSTNEDINSVLLSMGFDQMFRIVTEPRVSGQAACDSIEAPPPSGEDLRQTMLEAHRALVCMSEAGRLEFQTVVECLESECAAG